MKDEPVTFLNVREKLYMQWPRDLILQNHKQIDIIQANEGKTYLDYLDSIYLSY